jgi:hypothetical protein
LGAVHVLELSSTVSRPALGSTVLAAFTPPMVGRSGDAPHPVLVIDCLEDAVGALGSFVENLAY